MQSKVTLTFRKKEHFIKRFSGRLEWVESCNNVWKKGGGRGGGVQLCGYMGYGGCTEMVGYKGHSI